MKTLIIAMLITLVSMTAHANEFFINSQLTSLYVAKVDKEGGRAWIRDMNGHEEEVYLGDSIGVEGGTVIEIDELFITVQLNNEKRRMLLNKLEDIRIIDKEPGDAFPRLPGN